MSKIILYITFLTEMLFHKGFAWQTIKCVNIFRNTVIYDNKMPSVYLDNKYHIEDRLKSSIYTMEHIFPRSHMCDKHYNDLHNVARTINTLNVNRSNYGYTDILDCDENWIELSHNNFVNHKKKLFIPNKSSRGFISRAILYMCKEYNYKINKIIDKDILVRWFYENPPSKYEKYHNDAIKKMQNTNNIFISNYNKKKVDFSRYIDKIN